MRAAGALVRRLDHGRHFDCRRRFCANKLRYLPSWSKVSGTSRGSLDCFFFCRFLQHLVDSSSSASVAIRNRILFCSIPAFLAHALMNQFTQEAAGGLAAGIVGTVIGFPLDTIKARQQVLQTSGIRRTASTILHTEGFLAFYRGLVPPLLSLSLLNTINFATYASIQQYLQAPRGWHWKNALAGAMVGPLASIVSTVENVIKTQVQLDNVTAKRFSGSFDCLRTITRENGLSVIYTGHGVNTLRETTFIAVYFGVYEGIREQLAHWHHEKSDPSWNQWAVPAAGGLSGAIAWAVSFPLDCVRAGVQGQDLSTGSMRKSTTAVFRDLLSTKGIGGLYSGVAPSIARAFLVSASRFSAYEGALWLLRGGRDNF